MFHLRVLAGFYYLSINSVRETFCFLLASEQINSIPFYFLNSALVILQHCFQFSWLHEKFLYFKIHHL